MGKVAFPLSVANELFDCGRELFHAVKSIFRGRRGFGFVFRHDGSSTSTPGTAQRARKYPQRG
jgi:hypothetical protein